MPASPSPIVLARVETARGELVLRRVGEHLEVISNGVFLMDTRDGRSERLLVRAALDLHDRPRRMLIGGVGVGFSLVEALSDRRVEAVTVVEIEETIVRWHDQELAAWSEGALRDPRVRMVVDDVRQRLESEETSYDVICLDVDNGPDWTVVPANARLYDDAGLRTVLRRLAPGGVLSVWSAHRVPGFEQRLRDVGADVRIVSVDVARGEPDVVYLARPAPPSP